MAELQLLLPDRILLRDAIAERAAVLVGGGDIVAVGPADALASKHPQAARVELRGKALLTTRHSGPEGLQGRSWDLANGQR